eukprot:TRINITY_DN1639_c1_g1_i1.p1 TRINITY_DN1639_c1_g1~~TRINITY_DN1639_c1_g1_i1.p1  ORF type:complete len:1145 (+),score=403.89 TRINITY_DN1639_c1_g1_i1:148-3582(+)
MDRRRKKSENEEKHLHVDSIFDGNLKEGERWSQEIIESHIVWLILISKDKKMMNISQNFTKSLTKSEEKKEKINEIWKKTRLNPSYRRIILYLEQDSSEFLKMLKAEHDSRKRISESHGFSTEISILSSLMKEGTQSADLGEQFSTKFEGNDHVSRMEIVLSELCLLSSFSSLHFRQKRNEEQQQSSQKKKNNLINNQFKYDSELFSTNSYLNELKLIVPIAVNLLRIETISLTDIIGALLYLRKEEVRESLILSLFCNLPPLFPLLLDSLLSYSDLESERVIPILSKLSQMTPNLASKIRNSLLKNRKLPQFVIHLTLNVLKDDSIFFGSIINRKEEEREWIKPLFVQYNTRFLNDEIRGPNDMEIQTNLDENSDKIDCRMTKRVRDKLVENILDGIAVKDYNRVNSQLKIACGFMGLLNMEFNPQQINAILHLLSQNTMGNRVDLMGLCFILICKGLFKSCDVELLGKVLNDMTMRKEEGKEGDKERGVTEILMLISLYFHMDEVKSIVELIRNIMGMRVLIHTESLISLGKMINERIFLQDFVTKKVVNDLKVVENIEEEKNERSIKMLPFLAVFNIMKSPSRLCLKHSVDTSQWVLNQLLQAREPLHSMMKDFIQEYVQCVLASERAFEKIEEAKLKDIVEKEEKMFHSSQKETNGGIARLVLILYYILYFNEQSLKQRIEEKSVKSNIQEGYSTAFVDSLPLKSMLSHMERLIEFGGIIGRQYEEFYASFTCLAINQCPQLFNVLNLLNEEERNSNPVQKYLDLSTFVKFELEESTLQNALSQSLSFPIKASLVLQQMRSMPLNELFSFLPLLKDTIMNNLLDERLDHSILKNFEWIWLALYTQYPTEVSVPLINSLKSSPLKLVDHNAMVQDPLHILDVDRRAFRNPSVVKMILQILNSYMVASKRQLTNQGQLIKKVEETTTLSLSIDSAIVQLLLEICVLNPNEDKELGVIQDVRIQICLFIHDVFIDNPLMAKLIHFQGYNHTLIPMTVGGIPSMHICLDFIPELLLQPQIEKQVFAVKLAASLIEKFPIPKSMDCAKQVMHHIRGKANINEIRSSALLYSTKTPDNQQPSFILETVESLIPICVAFPSMSEEIFSILLENLPSEEDFVSYPLLKSLSVKVKQTIHEITEQILVE